LDQTTIRVFVGFRDETGASRIGAVDVDAANPTKVIRVSKDPVLDIGEPGTFDDNGVVPCAAVEREGKVYLYYSGYQLARKVKFLAFGGLATSSDRGGSFTRYKKVPIFERTAEEPLFRAIHCILFEGSVWKAWYSAGTEFVEINGIPHPVYDTRYIESADGVRFAGSGEVCIPLQHADEYRVGRPSVIRTGDVYRMFYSWATTKSALALGYATSKDARQWVRRDDELDLTPSKTGWDSIDMCYPSVLVTERATYLFYNGNDFGRAGFGVASLRNW
jgi:hypothetical protein